jgi:hypothetical protein
MSEEEEQAFLALVQEKIPTKIRTLGTLIDEWVTPVSVGDLAATIEDCICPEIFELMEHVQHCTRFLHGRTPTIEDGNNFGVDVLASVIALISKIYGNAQVILSNSSTYLLNTAQRQAHAIKYPDASAYQLAYRVSVAMYCGYIISDLRDIRDAYILIKDLVVKNLTLLLVPRKKQESGMYE